MDVRLIDRLMENHFTDEVDGKTCVVTCKNSPYNWSDEYDLTFLELRIELQEEMIYNIAHDLGIVSRSLAAELTERSEIVDESLIDVVIGASGSSPAYALPSNRTYNPPQ